MVRICTLHDLSKNNLRGGVGRSISQPCHSLIIFCASTLFRHTSLERFNTVFGLLEEISSHFLIFRCYNYNSCFQRKTCNRCVHMNLVFLNTFNTRIVTVLKSNPIAFPLIQIVKSTMQLCVLSSNCLVGIT